MKDWFQLNVSRISRSLNILPSRNSSWRLSKEHAFLRLEFSPSLSALRNPARSALLTLLESKLREGGKPSLKTSLGIKCHFTHQSQALVLRMIPLFPKSLAFYHRLCNSNGEEQSRNCEDELSFVEALAQNVERP